MGKLKVDLDRVKAVLASAARSDGGEGGADDEQGAEPADWIYRPHSK